MIFAWSVNGNRQTNRFHWLFGSVFMSGMVWIWLSMVILLVSDWLNYYMWFETQHLVRHCHEYIYQHYIAMAQVMRYIYSKYKQHRFKFWFNLFISHIHCNVDFNVLLINSIAKIYKYFYIINECISKICARASCTVQFLLIFPKIE